MSSRPPPGTVGRQVVAQTNAFVMHWNRPSNNSGYVYQYDVILPLWDIGSRQFSLGNKKGTEIIMRLQHTFRVPWDNRPSPNSPQKEVGVRIVFVKRIDVSTLHRLTQGDPDSIRPESDSSTAINMLNLFIQSTPRMSVRPTFGKIVVNADVTIGVILPADNLEKICAEYLHLRGIRYLDNLEESSIKKLRLFLKGVKVDVGLPGHSGKRPKTIKDVVVDVGNIKFDKGMSAGRPHDIVRSPPVILQVAEVLDEAGRLANATMILAILPESAPEPYREIKRFGDITRGVMTQCVKWSRKLASDVQQRRANQYYNNLILKINVKLGGINYMPLNGAMKYLNSLPTMVIGADVSHPAPGSLLPSISALVASMDNRLCKYAASIRVQASRTEIIQDLFEMFKIALTSFYNLHDEYPKRIFVFRDGVSEGEFQTVLDQEVDAMKVISILDVLPETYGSNQATWPELTFIIVGKRHHFRFFGNAEAQDPRGNGNLYSGFVADQDIIHPVYQDFYLQSQPGLKGSV
ncbi:hypothetical protein C0995_001517 [Termitomyces sp. Mi166|nr:hypothetical protein C0995_001517 [Termitomyces sp. Mi166\